MKNEIKNRAESVRARLFTMAKSQNMDFDFMLLRYFQERFLYRLSVSPYADKFVLKGGLVLVFLNVPKTRITIDADFLVRRIKSTPDILTPIFREIASIHYDDGVDFKAQSISCEKIKEDADYEGLRFKIEARLGQVKKLLQFDLGFGDIVTPAPRSVEFPVLLDDQCPRIRMYPMETVIAEKFEAMIKLSIANSRMKDFYDVYLISHTCSFSSETLSNAIRKTFAARNTPLTDDIYAFSEDFHAHPSKQAQWTAFLKRARVEDMPQNLSDVVKGIALFLLPLVTGIIAGETSGHTWKAPGPWKSRKE